MSLKSLKQFYQNTYFNSLRSLCIKHLTREKWKTELTLIALVVTVIGLLMTVTVSQRIGFEEQSSFTERTLSSGIKAGYPYFCDILIAPNHPWFQFIKSPETLLQEGIYTQIKDTKGVKWVEQYIGDITLSFLGDQTKSWYVTPILPSNVSIVTGKLINRYEYIENGNTRYWLTVKPPDPPKPNLSFLQSLLEFFGLSTTSSIQAPSTPINILVKVEKLSPKEVLKILTTNINQQMSVLIDTNRVVVSALGEKASQNRIIIAGIDPSVEEQRLREEGMILSGRFPEPETMEVVIGYNFMKNNNISIGDLIRIPMDSFEAYHDTPGQTLIKAGQASGQYPPSVWGQMQVFLQNQWNEYFQVDVNRDLILKVTGIFWTATPYDNQILIDYHTVQQTFEGFQQRYSCILIKINEEEDVNTILLKLWDISGVNVFIPTVKRIFLVGSDVSASGQFSGISQTQFTSVTNLQLTAIIVAASAIFIFAITYAKVIERHWEIGLMKSIGFTSNYIIASIMFEAIILGVIAAIGGFIGASILTIIANAYFALDVQLKLSITWGFIAITISICISTLGSLIPAIIAARLSPVEAMRQI